MHIIRKTFGCLSPLDLTEVEEYIYSGHLMNLRRSLKIIMIFKPIHHQYNRTNSRPNPFKFKLKPILTHNKLNLLKVMKRIINKIMNLLSKLNSKALDLLFKNILKSLYCSREENLI